MVKDLLKMNYFNPLNFDVYVFDVDECILQGHSLVIISYYLFRRYILKNPLISIKFFISGIVLYVLKILNLRDFEVSNKILLNFFMFGLKGVNVSDFRDGILRAMNKIEPEFYEFLKRIGDKKKLIFISFGVEDLIHLFLSRVFKTQKNIKIVANRVYINGNKIKGYGGKLLWRREDKLKVLELEVFQNEKALLFGHSENELLMCEFLRGKGGTCVGIGSVKNKNKKKFDLIFKNWKNFVEVTLSAQ